MFQTFARTALALTGLSLATSFAQSDPRPADLSITARAPRTATAAEGVKVDAVVKNTSNTDQTLALGRNSDQNCAFAPHVRVLRVGTREVVYPSGQPRICTQELRAETIPANGEVTLSRTLTLAPGEYVIEVWIKGFSGNAGVFLGGEPQRVTVKE